MNPDLDLLARRYWNRRLEADPLVATALGDHRFDHLLPDLSEEGHTQLHSDLECLLDEVLRLDPWQLRGQDLLTWGMLGHELRTRLTFLDVPVVHYPVDQMLGPHAQLLRLLPQGTPQTPEHAAALTQRVRGIPAFLAQATDWHRRQISSGLPPAAVNVRRALAQLDAYLATPLEADPLAALPAPPDWEGETAWREQLREVVRSQVRPAFGRYREMVEEEVLPVARPDDRPGICWLPQGEEVYGRLAEAFITLPVDPAQVHRIGVEAATELAEELTRLGEDLWGSGERGEVLDRLRDDPQLRYRSAEEMLTEAEGAIRRAWEASPSWFGRLPSQPPAVREVPSELAPNLPPAYYLAPADDGSRPGIYFLNTYRADESRRFEAEAFAFHEAVPGHHFQITLAAELEELPDFRRHAIVFAYSEGWGLYAERLADEMGLYGSELGRMGMVTADSWRAGRLVVDTGMHHHGWSRQQAVEFLSEWTAVAPSTISQEVDRYIGWPGQALSYKMGQRELFRLREAARDRLGSRFDMAGFHDTVLTSGAVTLAQLGELVEAWVESRRRAEGGDRGSGEGGI